MHRSRMLHVLAGVIIDAKYGYCRSISVSPPSLSTSKRFSFLSMPSRHLLPLVTRWNLAVTKSGCFARYCQTSDGLHSCEGPNSGAKDDEGDVDCLLHGCFRTCFEVEQCRVDEAKGYAGTQLPLSLIHI